MDAQSFCSSHLICIFLSQGGGEEHLVELADRLGVLKAASIHLQNDLFEFFLHGGLTAELEIEVKIKGCDIGCALDACSREGASDVDARTVTAFWCDCHFRSPDSNFSLRSGRSLAAQQVTLPS